MHKRPKKHTPSDINRNNVNLNVALEQLPEYKAIPDFTIVSYERKFCSFPLSKTILVNKVNFITRILKG